jgi:hypothetical protein
VTLRGDKKLSRFAVTPKDDFLLALSKEGKADFSNNWRQGFAGYKGLRQDRDIDN